MEHQYILQTFEFIAIKSSGDFLNNFFYKCVRYSAHCDKFQKYLKNYFRILFNILIYGYNAVQLIPCIVSIQNDGLITSDMVMKVLMSQNVVNVACDTDTTVTRV